MRHLLFYCSALALLPCSADDFVPTPQGDASNSEIVLYEQRSGAKCGVAGACARCSGAALAAPARNPHCAKTGWAQPILCRATARERGERGVVPTAAQPEGAAPTLLVLGTALQAHIACGARDEGAGEGEVPLSFWAFEAAALALLVWSCTALARRKSAGESMFERRKREGGGSGGSGGGAKVAGGGGSRGAGKRGKAPASAGAARELELTGTGEGDRLVADEAV
jgi:uncharacterized membrane protein YgcG